MAPSPTPSKSIESSTLAIGNWSAEQFSLPFSIGSNLELKVAAKQIADDQLELRNLTQKRNEALNRVIDRLDAKYADKTEALRQAIDVRLDAAFAYCQKNEADLFNESAEIEAIGARIKFKRCPHSVRELPGWTKDKIVAAFRKWFLGARYVRIKFEIDKNAIKADREKRKAFQWQRRGVEIYQARSLTITPTSDAEASVSLTR